MRISEESNALDNLQKAYSFIIQTHSDENAWKWVILSIHSALFSFAICALKGTSTINVTIQTKKGERLISFPEAIEMVQDENRMRMTVMSKHLQLTDDEKRSIDRLHTEFRNELEHYIPKLWVIEVPMLPKMVTHCLDVIRFLAIESGNYDHFSGYQKRKIKSLIFQSKKFLTKMTFV